MDYKKTGQEILELIGGPENVDKLTHCATRLRFEFFDKGKVDREAIEKLEGVITVVDKGGQFQIVIGNEVQTAFRAIQEQLGGKSTSAGGSVNKAKKEKESLLTQFISIISTTFTPVIPAITGAGMIKAVLAILMAFGLIEDSSTTYQLLNMISDAAFTFMPVLLAYGASMKFGCSPIMAMTISLSMQHPVWSAFLGAGKPITFFGIPVVLADYAGTVLPIIFTVWIMSYVERFAEKVSPSMIKFFTKPLITLIVTAPIAFLAVGPIGVFLNDAVAAGAEIINAKASWLIPFLMGAFQPVLVVSGTAWAMTPIATMQITKMGSEMINGPGMLASNVAQGGATLAVALKAKNQELKQLAASTGLTATLGITEPSLYGVTLKLKRPLIASMIGGGIAGLYAGITGLVRYAFVSPGLAALPAFIGENPMNIVHAVITCVIAFVAAFAAAWILGFEEPEDTEKKVITENKDKNAERVKSENGTKKVEILAPLKGSVIPLSDVKDDVFSMEVLGKGVAIIPEEGILTAPADGEISALLDSKHAIGMNTEEGAEILIHVGMDTVNLEGKYFTAHVKTGDHVKKGDLLLTFEKDKIAAEGYEITTPIVISNYEEFGELKAVTGICVNRGDRLMHFEA